jgi:hypothetical protein
MSPISQMSSKTGQDELDAQNSDFEAQPFAIAKTTVSGDAP